MTGDLVPHVANCTSFFLLLVIAPSFESSSFSLIYRDSISGGKVSLGHRVRTRVALVRGEHLKAEDTIGNYSKQILA